MKASYLIVILSFLNLFPQLSSAQSAPPSVATTDNFPLQLTIAGSQLQLEISDPKLAAKKTILLEWIRYSAQAVKNYYGQFPVKKFTLKLSASAGNRVKSGRAFGGESPFISITVGDQVTPATLKKDWVLVHEMIHLALAKLPQKHHWLVEGLAVYIESVSRVQAGHLSQDTVWRGFFRGMPNGLPKHGDQGLDHTPTWGRKYWGGAIFCLLADIEIRQRSNNQMGLQDAMRAILTAGYSMNRNADIETLLKTGDQATNFDVLIKLYEKMKASPVTTNLPTLWHSLGVSQMEGKIVYNNNAPRALIRAKIFE